MPDLVAALFALSADIRYLALLRDGQLSLEARPGLTTASAAETDRYEELLVNPAVLTLLQRRGELDRGGLDHIWIRYGHFWTGLFPIPGGHLNLAVEPDAVPTTVHAGIRRCPRAAGLG